MCGRKLVLNVVLNDVSGLPRHFRRRHNNREFRNIRIPLRYFRTYKVHTLQEEYARNPLKNVNILLKGLRTTKSKWFVWLLEVG